MRIQLHDRLFHSCDDGREPCSWFYVQAKLFLFFLLGINQNNKYLKLMPTYVIRTWVFGLHSSNTSHISHGLHQCTFPWSQWTLVDFCTTDPFTTLFPFVTLQLPFAKMSPITASESHICPVKKNAEMKNFPKTFGKVRTMVSQNMLLRNIVMWRLRCICLQTNRPHKKRKKHYHLLYVYII